HLRRSNIAHSPLQLILLYDLPRRTSIYQVHTDSRLYPDIAFVFDHYNGLIGILVNHPSTETGRRAKGGDVYEVALVKVTHDVTSLSERYLVVEVATVTATTSAAVVRATGVATAVVPIAPATGVAGATLLRLELDVATVSLHDDFGRVLLLPVLL